MDIQDKIFELFERVSIGHSDIFDRFKGSLSYRPRFFFDQTVGNCGKAVEHSNPSRTSEPRSLTILVLISLCQLWFVDTSRRLDPLLPLEPLKPQYGREAAENCKVNGFELASFSSWSLSFNHSPPIGGHIPYRRNQLRLPPCRQVSFPSGETIWQTLRLNVERLRGQILIRPVNLLNALFKSQQNRKFENSPDRPQLERKGTDTREAPDIPGRF
jgi:hypothetical protein